MVSQGTQTFPSASNSSSALYDPDDPEFLEILQSAVLSGDDIPQTTAGNDGKGSDGVSKKSNPAEPVKTRGKKREREEGDTHAGGRDVITFDDGTEVYGEAHFGNFGEYMRRKRAKLQIQNAQMIGKKDGVKSGIFTGIAIYVNGYTTPSVQTLRKLVIEYGGVFQPYLDAKGIVTHIITCSLTPAKVREFKNMKVVRPEWITDSIKAGTLLPWRDYIFQASGQGRALVTQGAKNTQQQRSLEETSTQAQNQPKASSTGIAGAGAVPATAASKAPKPLQREAASTRAGPSLVSRSSTSPIKTSAATAGPSKTAPQDLDSLFTTDPAREADARRVPGYATHESNLNAQRVMADPAWRAAHTSAAPDFIEGYYKNSRLHHLSSWKAELRSLVAQAQERAERDGFAIGLEGTAAEDTEDTIMADVDGAGGGGDSGGGGVSMMGAELVLRSPSKKSKGKGKEIGRVIMHCDFDAFFVSAGLIERPHLRGTPVVVCHSQGGQGGGSSTSEIASASYEARKFGIKSGMSLQQARKLCPDVQTMPYEFEKYKQISLQFYTILMRYANDLQAVSVDEALVDVSTAVATLRGDLTRSGAPGSATRDYAKELAETIRSKVRRLTDCEVSVGIGENILLARLATRRAKPAGSFHLHATDVSEYLAPLDIRDLHGFGYHLRQKAQQKLGATDLGTLMKKSKGQLCAALGPGTGEVLYKALRGVDERPLESDKPRKSVSCDINYGIRFQDVQQAEAFIRNMAVEVSHRLDAINMRGRSLTLKIMKRDPSAPVEAPKFLGHGLCETFNKQAPLGDAQGRATSSPEHIAEQALCLLKALAFDPKELRGVAIQITKLESTSGGATSAAPGQGKLLFQPNQKAGSVSPTKPMDGAPTASTSKTFPQQQQQARFKTPPPPPPRQPSPEAKLPPNQGNQTTNEFDLPSFSQVDRSVFDALPASIRSELNSEYERRSRSRSVSRPRSPFTGASVSPEKRSTGLLPPAFGAGDPIKPRIFVKGIKPNVNVKQITRQLRPHNRTSISPRKNSLFAPRGRGGGASTRGTGFYGRGRGTSFKRGGGGYIGWVTPPKKNRGVKSLAPTDDELRALAIEPEVYHALPYNVQREQLVTARHLAAGGEIEAPRVIKDRKRKVRAIPKMPPPYGKHEERPTLKRQVVVVRPDGPDGEKKKEEKVKVAVGDVGDVLGMLDVWVKGCQHTMPQDGDIERFGKFVERCVDAGDNGMQRAVKVLRGWLVILRRVWGIYENIELLEDSEDEDDDDVFKVGNTEDEARAKAWWEAFQTIKTRADVAARKRFGGKLSIA
ncbi:DNA repair protein [Coniophora puteana RWD-64-598 SS2]|uniref:DNA repair protein REV1 n=1 Tax=Coniophora puteana (strain RWD-64-598) TaxID=741705 RepID=A0A5M3N3K3_CONPW|nr:DNA repair protein [Coniophora puteana RWD-64-598 SS2]EIW85594.1 DNA repair protein [Coniophora puteana RWD-64-598 SS2]